MRLSPDTLLVPPPNSTNKPVLEVLHPPSPLNGAVAYDPDKELDYKKEIEHPASFDLNRIIHESDKVVDAQIMECDRAGRYRLASYDKNSLFERLSSAPVFTASPERPLTLREAVFEKYGKVLREDYYFDRDDSITSSGFSEPFANFTPLFIGPYYRQQYMYKMLEAKSKIYDAWVNNPVAHRIPLLITQFTLGKGVTVTTHDDITKNVWNKFATVNKIGTSMHSGLARAGSRLRMWSNQLSVDGESMFQFIETPENLLVKNLDTATILDIVTDPEDIEKVHYYHQQFCLVGDTQIKLIDGTSPTIEEITHRHEAGAKDMWVYSYDHERNKIVPGLITWASNQGKKECWEVTLDNGEKIIASFDHPFLLRDGTYVWASKLKPGTSLMPLYTRNVYEEIYQPEGKWEPTHQIVTKEVVDPKYQVGYGEVVHHIDNDRSNNHPSNLQVMKKSEHTKLTIKERWEDDSAAEEKEKLHNHKVVSVKKVGERVVFDITVDKYHNFALEAGVFTHNTTRFMQYITDSTPSTKYIIRQIPGNDVLHYKINCYENEVRGRSDLFSVIGWIKRLKDLVNANVLRAYFQACYTYDVEVDGSPAMVSSLASAYKNHVPTPGAQYIHNKNIKRTPMPPVAGTGAGSDSDMVGLMNLISLGTGIPPAYLIGTMAANRAGVLTETEPSTKFFFERQCVWDEIFHGFFDRLARWHYSRTGQMLDENIEFTFPAVNTIEKMSLIQSLTLMRDAEWFSDDRCAEIAAKEWNVTAYNLENEREKIMEEKKRKVQDAMEVKQAESAAQSRLSFYQDMLADASAKATQEQFGYDPQTGQSAETMQAQQQQEQAGQQQQQQMQGEKHGMAMQSQANKLKQTGEAHKQKLKHNEEQHKAKLKALKSKNAGGKIPPNAPRRPANKGGSNGVTGRVKTVNSAGRSSSGGLSEKERAQTRRNVSARGHD